MRCPYCGERNPDGISFCTRCGRDLRTGAQTRQGQRPLQPPPAMPARNPGPQRHTAPPPPQQAKPAPQAQQAGTRTATRRRNPPANAKQLDTLPPPVAPREGPEPPVPFPPRTLEQLKALEKEGLEYTVLQDDLGYGRKKIVKISFAHTVSWLQVATLLKALSTYRTQSFDTIVIQGTYAQGPDIYEFTNGQLQYDRKTRLGSQLVDRYLIDSGTGLEGDAVRIVFHERS